MWDIITLSYFFLSVWSVSSCHWWTRMNHCQCGLFYCCCFWKELNWEIAFFLFYIFWFSNLGGCSFPFFHIWRVIDLESKFLWPNYIEFSIFMMNNLLIFNQLYAKWLGIKTKSKYLPFDFLSFMKYSIPSSLFSFTFQCIWKRMCSCSCFHLLCSLTICLR